MHRPASDLIKLEKRLTVETEVGSWAGAPPRGLVCTPQTLSLSSGNTGRCVEGCDGQKCLGDVHREQFMQSGGVADGRPV